MRDRPKQSWATASQKHVDSVMGEGLGAFLEENPPVAKRILGKITHRSRAREAARKARELTRRKSALESSTLPGSWLIVQTGTLQHRIVSGGGDSAGGSAKQGVIGAFRPSCPCGEKY